MYLNNKVDSEIKYTWHFFGKAFIIIKKRDTH